MRTSVVTGGGKFQVGRSCGYRFQTHSRQGFNLQSEIVQAEITRLLGGIPKLNAIMLTGEPRLSCAICEIRKEKRFCPAVHGRICPQCCGEQREVTLDCPSDCTYLLQARAHEKPRSAEQIDPAALFLQIEVSDQFMYEKEHLLMGLTFALAKAARSNRALHDQDLIAALSMLATSYERRVNSGLQYEPPLSSDSERRAAAEIENMVKEYREAEQKVTGFSSLRDSEVLKALVFLVRLAHGRTSGRPKSRAFVEFLFSQFPEKETAAATSAGTGSRIILP
jgi:hypothetical protein